MSSIYTGQHGEFYVWVQESALGSTETFDISTTGGSKGVEHRIQKQGASLEVIQLGRKTWQLRSSWEYAGWTRQNEDDYPSTGDRFIASGEKVSTPSGWSWHEIPKAAINIPGDYVRAGQVRNWSFSNTAETIDTTVLGDTWRDKVPGLKSMTGQAQLMYYRDNDDSDSPVSAMLDLLFYQDSELQRGQFRVMFRLHHSSRGTRTQSFPAIITNWSMACAVGEVVTVDVSFECQGDPYRNVDGI